MAEYKKMQAAHVFPIPRAIAVYQGSLIASVTQMDGAHAGRFLARLQETINRI